MTTTNEEDLSGLCPGCAEPLDQIGRCPKGCDDDDDDDDDDDCLAVGHDDEITFEDDDVIQWRCNRCGAEGVEDKKEGAMSGYVVDKHETRVARVQERRRSGAAGPHADRRQRRVRTRSAARRAAVEEARRG